MIVRRPRTIALLCVAVITAVGLWLLVQKHSTVPGTQGAASAVDSVPKRSNDVKASVALHEVNPPTAAPVSPSPVAATVPSGQAALLAKVKAELEPVFFDIGRLRRAGDEEGIFLAYYDKEKLSPEELADQLESAKASSEANKATIRDDPDAAKYVYAFAQLLENLNSETPVINTAGDEATYQSTLPVGELTKGYPDQEGVQYKVIFVKINGHWYQKDFEIIHTVAQLRHMGYSEESIGSMGFTEEQLK